MESGVASKVDRSRYPVRKIRLEDEGKDLDVRAMTPSERVDMVWELTKAAWELKAGPCGEYRIRRDVVRTLRLGR